MGAHSLLGIIHWCWTTSSHRAPSLCQSMPAASWGWGMLQLSLARTLDPSHMVQATLRNWELMLGFPPPLFFFFLFTPPFCLSSRQAVKDPLQLSRQRRIMKTVP